MSCSPLRGTTSRLLAPLQAEPHSYQTGTHPNRGAPVLRLSPPLGRQIAPPGDTYLQTKRVLLSTKVTLFYGHSLLIYSLRSFHLPAQSLHLLSRRILFYRHSLLIYSLRSFHLPAQTLHLPSPGDSLLSAPSPYLPTQNPECSVPKALNRAGVRDR